MLRAGLLCLLLAGLGVMAFPAASGWTTPPTYSRSSAGRVLREARSAGAARWAAPVLSEAERTLREAEVELRRQQLRLPPFRDYREAQSRFRDAESAAARAAESARRVRGEAFGTSAAAVDLAGCVVARTDELNRRFRLGSGVDELMRASKLRLNEARFLLSADEPGLARLRADEALARTRLARERMRGVLERFVDAESVRRWRQEQAETIAQSKRTGGAAIVVNKDRSVLDLYVAGRRVRRFGVEIGRNQLARKLTVGDNATPEGRYRVTRTREGGATRYYKALDLDYPNAEDRGRLRSAVEQRRLPASATSGSLIEIHGDGGRGWDWTDGCVALENGDMDELFAHAASGTPVAIIGSAGDGGRFSALARVLEDEEIEHECGG